MVSPLVTLTAIPTWLVLLTPSSGLRLLPCIASWLLPVVLRLTVIVWERLLPVVLGLWLLVPVVRGRLVPAWVGGALLRLRLWRGRNRLTGFSLADDLLHGCENLGLSGLLVAVFVDELHGLYCLLLRNIDFVSQSLEGVVEKRCQLTCVERAAVVLIVLREYLVDDALQLSFHVGECLFKLQSD